MNMNCQCRPCKASRCEVEGMVGPCEGPWTRKHGVTRGSDPTEVVTWENGTTTLTEFQGIICVEPGHTASMVQALGEALHAALERVWRAEQDRHPETDGLLQNLCVVAMNPAVAKWLPFGLLDEVKAYLAS